MDYITVVSGLPRSGTSMMMRMLQAGGMPIVTDHVRKADIDNPKGYFELEKVKQIREDSSWVADTVGKAFKMVSQLLYDLPPFWNYRIILMKRNMGEVLRSQAKMLERLGRKRGSLSDLEMAELFTKHLDALEEWLEQQPHMKTLIVHYRQVIHDPLGKAREVNRFLDEQLDAPAMAAEVDPSLYRQRVKVSGDSNP